MQRTGGLGYAASPLPPAEGQGEGASFGVGSQVATVSMRLKPSTVRTSVPGDLVYCVSDADGEGPIDVRPVEQVYHNAPARLLNIHMGDEIIRATPNHPFYVRHRGWTAAGCLA